jgi:hypothetical protein
MARRVPHRPPCRGGIRVDFVDWNTVASGRKLCRLHSRPAAAVSLVNGFTVCQHGDYECQTLVRRCVHRSRGLGLGVPPLSWLGSRLSGQVSRRHAVGAHGLLRFGISQRLFNRSARLLCATYFLRRRIESALPSSMDQSDSRHEHRALDSRLDVSWLDMLAYTVGAAIRVICKSAAERLGCRSMQR